jgi:hypothetical protein
MHTALVVGAVVTLAGAIVAARWLPARAADEAPEPEAERAREAVAA